MERRLSLSVIFGVSLMTPLSILYAITAVICSLWLLTTLWFGSVIVAHVIESKRKGRAI